MIYTLTVQSDSLHELQDVLSLLDSSAVDCPASETPQETTLQDVRAAIFSAVESKSKEYVAGCFTRLRITKISDLDPSQYRELIECLRA